MSDWLAKAFVAVVHNSKDLKCEAWDVNGGVKFGHCGGAKVGQFGASALERAALI